MKSNVKDAILKTCDDELDGRESAVAELSRRVWARNMALISASVVTTWACGPQTAETPRVTVRETGKTAVPAKTGNNAVPANNSKNAVPATEDAVYSGGDQKSDADTMNVALALEHEAIALYTAAAGLPVWDAAASALAPTFLEVAKVFLGHHTTHRDALISQINAIKSATGVAPVATKAAADYLAYYPGIATLKGPEGLLTVLQVAAEREMNASNAYYYVIKSCKNI